MIMPRFNHLDERITSFSQRYHKRPFGLSVMSAVLEITIDPLDFVTVANVVDTLWQPIPEGRDAYGTVSNELKWLVTLDMLEQKQRNTICGPKLYERTKSGLWNVVPIVVESSLGMPMPVNKL